jgi:hypothetical protein
MASQPSVNRQQARSLDYYVISTSSPSWRTHVEVPDWIHLVAATLYFRDPDPIRSKKVQSSVDLLGQKMHMLQGRLCEADDAL